MNVLDLVSAETARDMEQRARHGASIMRDHERATGDEDRAEEYRTHAEDLDATAMLARTVIALHAIIEGRTVAPTDEELAAHDEAGATWMIAHASGQIVVAVVARLARRQGRGAVVAAGERRSPVRVAGGVPWLRRGAGCGRCAWLSSRTPAPSTTSLAGGSRAATTRRPNRRRAPTTRRCGSRRVTNGLPSRFSPPATSPAPSCAQAFREDAEAMREVIAKFYEARAAFLDTLCVDDMTDEESEDYGRFCEAIDAPSTIRNIPVPPCPEVSR